MKKFREFFILFLTFVKIGTFTIGGGLVMVALMEKVIVKDKKWLDEEEMLDCIAVSQSLPGILAVNTATYVGNRVGGIRGAVVATAGVVLPSFCIIIVVMSLIGRLGDSKVLTGIMTGIKAGVCGLIATSAIGLARKSVKGLIPVIILVLTFALVAWIGLNPIFIILGAFALGVVVKLCGEKRTNNG